MALFPEPYPLLHQWCSWANRQIHSPEEHHHLLWHVHSLQSFFLRWAGILLPVPCNLSWMWYPWNHVSTVVSSYRCTAWRKSSFQFICLDIYRVRIKYLVVRIMYHYSIHRFSLDGNKSFIAEIHQFLIISILHEYRFLLASVGNESGIQSMAPCRVAKSPLPSAATTIWHWSLDGADFLVVNFQAVLPFHPSITPLPIFTSYSCPYSNVLLCR